MNEQLLARGSILVRIALFVIRTIHLRVHEIVDDVNGVLHPEDLQGLHPQIFADGSDSVRSLDRKFGDGEVTAIRADERDVGSVQRRDEGQAAPGRGHLLRE